MTINISLPDKGANLRPKIIVMGVGGAGGNAVNNMIHSNLEGVDFLIANTDAQALENSSCDNKIQLGIQNTKGLGAGMRPDIGRQAAEEVMDEIKSKLNESHMIFIAAGMGGGTGTGAAPVIAQLARDIGILTVGVVTKPFHFEGTQRMKLAEEGIENLQQQVDTLITIPNQNLFRIANEKTTFSDAFKMADDVLYAGVRGVTDLMVQPGLINLDFSDIKTVMSEMGKAMMGTAQSDAAEGRAIEAAEKAIANPLIDDVSLKGARGLIINITGGNDLTLYEVDEAANRIKQEVQDEANIIYGTTCDERLQGVIRVSIVATGIDSNSSIANQPKDNKATLAIDNSVYQSSNHLNDVANKHSLSNEIEENDLLHAENHSNNIEIKNDENLVSNLLDENLDNNKADSVFYNENHSSSEKDQGALEISENEKIELNENPIIEESNDIQESAVIEEADSKETARRLSLFDTLNESSNENEVDTTFQSSSKADDKNEPVLENNEKLTEENTSDEDFSDHFSPEEETSEQGLDQDSEEELLDIPTFLRRQAN